MRAERALPVVLALLALTLAAPAPVALADGEGGCADVDLVPDNQNLDQVKVATLCLINQQRAAAGEVALARDPRLEYSASFHSVDMVRYHYFGHRGPNRPALLERVLDSGYFSGAAGGLYAENIGEGPQPGASANRIVAAWMVSGDHRANILDARLEAIGLGVSITGPDPAFYATYPAALFVTDFGRRTEHGDRPPPPTAAAKCATIRRRAARSKRSRRHSRRYQRRRGVRTPQYCLTNPAPPVGTPAPAGQAASASGGSRA